MNIFLAILLGFMFGVSSFTSYEMFRLLRFMNERNMPIVFINRGNLSMGMSTLQVRGAIIRHALYSCLIFACFFFVLI